MQSILKLIWAEMVFCLAVNVVHAQAVTLNINGRITNTPCTIAVGPVTMGEVPIGDFEGSGLAPEKYWKNFSVILGGCELSTLNTASLKFFGATNENMTLALKNGAGAAQGFGILIMTNDTTHMSANQQVVDLNGSTSYAFKVESGKKTFDFQAAYMATSAMRKPGTANATATITLTYS